ncbi:hypothetical protein T8K17_19150 [Thalassobaculum sp. OXR-137]|uniref:hypothetical protein n=1 Tax=Thalassobaculum sp. OXR-137 TaxID=3100173 RepID=UPI002AC914B8|nr:hypothetical protein [Thalassobaculum sp. OXR-137]WPZ33343.1 hypothetical protein T8K17_19150 [Thalassobaculum sp. OXR-137]
MTLVLFSILWKTLATASVIIAAGRLARRLGPLLTSVLITMPFNAGPGFFFVALDQERQFIAEGALMAFGVTGIILIYCTAWVHAARRFNFVVTSMLGICAWLVCVLILDSLTPSLTVAACTVAIGAVAAYVLRRRDIPKPVAPPSAAGWRFAIVRGLAAGIVVATVATASPWLGAHWSGILLAFPTTLLASTWMLWGHYGRDFTAATMNAAQPSLVVYGCFCLALHLLAGPMNGVAAVLTAFALSGVVAGLYAAVLMRLSRR